MFEIHLANNRKLSRAMLTTLDHIILNCAAQVTMQQVNATLRHCQISCVNFFPSQTEDFLAAIVHIQESKTEALVQQEPVMEQS